MASRVWSDVKTLGRRRILIQGSFAPDSTDPPTDQLGLGWSVEYVSTGLFLVTFEDKYVNLESVTTGLQLATADNRSLQVGTYDPDARTLEIRSVDEDGTVQDIAADANNRIHFQCVFSDATTV